MKISITRSNIFKILRGAVVFLICTAIWDISALIVNEAYFFPGAKDTFIALLNLVRMPVFFKSILLSLLRVLAGLGIGIVFGILLATISHYFKLSDSLISPIVSIMKATPIATIILILWFTFSDAELAIFVVFW